MAEMTYKQLQKAVADMGKSVTRASEAIRVKAREIDEEAKDTARVGEMIGGMRVDTSTLGETRELSKIMAGLSEATLSYATAGDTTAKAAQAAADQARTTHAGIQEAFSRSPVDISDTSREWFRQE